MDNTAQQANKANNQELVQVRDVAKDQTQLLVYLHYDCGVQSITGEFDGYGDSGDFHNLYMSYKEPGSDSVMHTDIDEHTFDHIFSDPHTVQDWLLNTCHDELGHRHGGWEIDDGSFGHVKLDLATCEFEIEYNERYTAHNTTVNTRESDTLLSAMEAKEQRDKDLLNMINQAASHSDNEVKPKEFKELTDSKTTKTDNEDDSDSARDNISS